MCKTFKDLCINLINQPVPHQSQTNHLITGGWILCLFFTLLLVSSISHSNTVCLSPISPLRYVFGKIIKINLKVPTL